MTSTLCLVLITVAVVTSLYINPQINLMLIAAGLALIRKFPEQSKEFLILMAVEPKLFAITVGLTWAMSLPANNLHLKTPVIVSTLSP
jgi:hypothetical protein